MLYGKSGVHILVVLIFVSLLTAGAPYLLPWWRSGPSHHSLTDVRDERYLKPYDVVRPVSGDWDSRYSIHGKLFPISFTHHGFLSGADENPLQPLESIEAAIGEEAILPDGSQLKLIGMRMLPFIPRGSPSTEKPIEGSYYWPDGTKMEPREADEFHESVQGYRSGVYLETTLNGPPWNGTLFFQSSNPKNKINPLGIRDTVTGGHAAFTHSPSTKNRDIEERNDLTVIPFEYVGVRPTPLAMHLKVWQGEPTVINLTPEVDESFTWKGREYRIEKIEKSRYTSVGQMPLDDDRLNDPTVTVYKDLSRIEIYFNELMEELVSINLYDKSGKTFGRGGGSSGHEHVSIKFNGNIDSIDRLEMVLQPDYVHVVFNLPQMPVIPEENFEKDDLMKMSVPTMTVEDQSDLNRVISNILQVTYSPPQNTKPIFPQTFQGMTVEELLDWEYNQYPEHEILLKKTKLGTSLERVKLGETIENYGPWWTKLFSSLPTLANVLFIITFVLFFFKVRLMIYSHSIQRQLRLKGYTDVDLWKAEMFFYYLGTNVKRVPNHDDLATIPNVDVTNPSSIAKFLHQNKREQS